MASLLVAQKSSWLKHGRGGALEMRGRRLDAGCRRDRDRGRLDQPLILLASPTARVQERGSFLGTGQRHHGQNRNHFRCMKRIDLKSLNNASSS